MKNSAKVITCFFVAILTFSCSTTKKTTSETTTIDPALLGTWQLEGIKGGDAISLVEEKLVLTFSAPEKAMSANTMKVEMHGPCSRRIGTLILLAERKIEWGEFNQPVEACDVRFEEEFLRKLRSMVSYEFLDSSRLTFSDGRNEMLADGLWFKR